MASPTAFEFELGTEEGAPPIASQRNLLQCLTRWRILFIQPEFAADTINPPTLFTIRFIRNRFDDIYNLFSNGLKADVTGEKIYDLANIIFSRSFRLTFTADTAVKEFEAWLIISGKYLGTKKYEFKSGIPAEPIIKLPVGTTWIDIEIRFKNTFDIDIFVRSKHVKTSDHIELGFFKSGTKKRIPDRQWSMLHAIAMICTVAKQRQITTPTSIADFSREFGSQNAVMKIKQKLSQQLQAVFGLKDDPFEEYNKLGRYQTKFKLVAEPELRNDNLHESGFSFDDSILYDKEIE